MANEKRRLFRSEMSATFFPKLKLLRKVSFKPFVDTGGYSTQTSCLLQILLIPLHVLFDHLYIDFIKEKNYVYLIE